VPRRNRIRTPDEPPPLRGASNARTEVRGGREWHVQPISSLQALKVYRCPGCGGTVDEGVAHLVVWRADGVLGDRADLEARRHWHLTCWRVA
jgi:hypothetical protein